MAALFLPSTSPLQAKECPPAALLQGDPALVDAVGDLLRARGIATAPIEECPRVSVVLLPMDARIDVEVTDAWGRQERRRVADVATVATIVESWCRTDLVDALLAPPTGLTAVPARTVVLEPGTNVGRPGMADAVPPPVRYAIGIHPGVAYEGDGSVWVDVGVSACGNWGPVCVGGLVRGGGDVGELGDSARFDSKRAGLDVLATIDYPIDLKSVILTPGLGFGGGWIRASGPQGTNQHGAVDIDSGFMRVEGAFRVGIPLAERFAFDVGVSAGVSPLAHTSAFVEDNLTVAGVPSWSVRGTVGFVYRGR